VLVAYVVLVTGAGVTVTVLVEVVPPLMLVVMHRPPVGGLVEDCVADSAIE
jgi:hypothetical protein